MNWSNLKSCLVLLLVSLLALGVLGYYSYVIKEEDLRPWRTVLVVFKDVRGLKANDEVRVRGAAVGRVFKIELYEDKQLVTLQINPQIAVHDGAQAKVISVNAIGTRAVELDTGNSQAVELSEDVHVMGEVEPINFRAPGWRREIKRNFEEYARRTREIRDTERSPVGQLIYDPIRGTALREGVADLARQAIEIDAALTSIENGMGFGRALLSQDARIGMQDSTGKLRRLLEDAKLSLAEADQGQGAAGRVLGEGNATNLREIVEDQGFVWSEMRGGHGAVGRLVAPEGTGYDSLYQTLGVRLKEASGHAKQGQGLLGALTSPEYNQVTRDGLDDLNAYLTDLEQAPWLRNRDVPEMVGENVMGAEDWLKNMRRGARSFRQGQAQYTFQGAVFSIF